MVNDMLLIATSLVGGFIFAALLTEDVDDDDNGPDSGLMQPVYHRDQKGPFFSKYLCLAYLMSDQNLKREGRP